MVPVLADVRRPGAVGDLEVRHASGREPGGDVAEKLLRPLHVLEHVVGDDELEASAKARPRSAGVPVDDLAVEPVLAQVQSGQPHVALVLLDAGHLRPRLGEGDQESAVRAADVEHPRGGAAQQPAATAALEQARKASGGGAAAVVGRDRVLEVQRQHRMVAQVREVPGQGFEELLAARGAPVREALGHPPRRVRGRIEGPRARFHTVSKHNRARGCACRLFGGALVRETACNGRAERPRHRLLRVRQHRGRSDPRRARCGPAPPVARGADRRSLGGSRPDAAPPRRRRDRLARPARDRAGGAQVRPRRHRRRRPLPGLPRRRHRHPADAAPWRRHLLRGTGDPRRTGRKARRAARPRVRPARRRGGPEDRRRRRAGGRAHLRARRGLARAARVARRRGRAHLALGRSGLSSRPRGRAARGRAHRHGHRAGGADRRRRPAALVARRRARGVGAGSGRGPRSLPRADLRVAALRALREESLERRRRLRAGLARPPAAAARGSDRGALGPALARRHGVADRRMRPRRRHAPAFDRLRGRGLRPSGRDRLRPEGRGAARTLGTVRARPAHRRAFRGIAGRADGTGPCRAGPVAADPGRRRRRAEAPGRVGPGRALRARRESSRRRRDHPGDDPALRRRALGQPRAHARAHRGGRRPARRSDRARAAPGRHRGSPRGRRSRRNGPADGQRGASRELRGGGAGASPRGDPARRPAGGSPAGALPDPQLPRLEDPRRVLARAAGGGARLAPGAAEAAARHGRAALGLGGARHGARGRREGAGSRDREPLRDRPAAGLGGARGRGQAPGRGRAPGLPDRPGPARGDGRRDCDPTTSSTRSTRCGARKASAPRSAS